MNQTKQKSLIPFFTGGDVGGIAYSLANNIVNYVIVITVLSGSLGWPDEIVFGRVVPGMSMGLLAGGLYYAYMAHKLSRREQRLDVTALPSGISTPVMFVILYSVIVPLHYSLGDPELAWAAGVAACFIGGFIEFLGGFIGPWLRKTLPRAVLLGTLAGIAFIWMATQGVFDLYSDPVIGLPIMLIAAVGLFGGYIFPKKIPPFAVAIVGGIIYALLLGRTSFDFSGIGFYCPNPVSGVQALINGFAVLTPYLGIIIPVEILNFIETMDAVESAIVAGDHYNVREAQWADGAATMISALCGGVIPNTVWVGHPGLKSAKAGAAHSWVSGVALALAGVFGLFTFFSKLVPTAICAITFLWCALIMLSQAFKEVPSKHYAAIGIAMVPPAADYIFSQITSTMSANGIFTEILPAGYAGYSPEITSNLLANGVMWNGLPSVKAGMIIIGIVLGTLYVFIVDKRLDKAAVLCLVAAVLTLFGFMHATAIGLYPTSPYMIAYLISAAICFVLHLGRKSWFKPDNDFTYI